MILENIKLKIDEPEEKLFDIAAKKVKGFRYFKILKKSLDARDKENIRWVYTVQVERSPVQEQKKTYTLLKKPERVVIVGSGPSGLFCALRLLQAGICPTIVERGGTIEERIEKTREFFRERKLDEDCNIQFGEGGAGTFSDGKLNTQTKSVENKEVLETFAAFGAPQEITYLNKPHIGSDILRQVIVNIRKYILQAGGTFYFYTRFEDMVLRGGRIHEIVLRDVKTGKERKEQASELVLAIGHSSRDTFSMLERHNISMQQRDFAVGVRIEHLQSEIGKAQYGKMYDRLPPADYKLVSHAGVRSAFTFCMCPGGYVMPAASEAGGVVTNGMSNFARDGKNANAALLAQISRADYDRGNVMDGVAFQRALEQAAFTAGGNCYAAPAQRAEDFISSRCSKGWGEVLPTYEAGTAFFDLNKILPEYVCSSLKSAILDMDRRLKGFAHPDAVMTGVETRFSSPVRIVRDERGESESIKGVYPCGEGCGYSGGITSSAADGLKVGDKIIQKYSF